MKVKFASLLMVLTLLLAVVPAAGAAPVVQDDDPAEEVEVAEEPQEEAPEVEIDAEALITLLVVLAGFVPIVGGGMGSFWSAIVDLLKLLRIVPHKWGARLFVLLNVVGYIILFFVIRGRPDETPLPADVQAIVATLTTLVKAVTDFIGVLPAGVLPVVAGAPVAASFLGGGLAGGWATHKGLKQFIPEVSRSEDLGLGGVKRVSDKNLLSHLEPGR